MAKRITVTALEPLYHEGRSHVRGAVFTTTPVDAASLKYRGKVKLGGQLSGGTVPEHPSIARRTEPVKAFSAEAPETPAPSDPPMPGTEAPVETIEAPPSDVPEEPKESPRAPRGRGRAYQRRDMQAESGE